MRSQRTIPTPRPTPAKVAQLRGHGVTIKDIAARYGVSTSLVQKLIQQAREASPEAAK